MFLFRCSTIAIGKGKGYEQVMLFLSKLVESGFFGNLDVKFTVVDASGLADYSCSPEAKSEFPHNEPTTISASKSSLVLA